MSKWSVGQIVYRFPRSGVHTNLDRDMREFKIEKIGRKWGTFNNGQSKFALETGLVDAGDYTPHHQMYASIEEREVEVELERLWRSFSKLVGGYNMPAGMKAWKIKAALVVLGLVPEAKRWEEYRAIVIHVDTFKSKGLAGEGGVMGLAELYPGGKL